MAFRKKTEDFKENYVGFLEKLHENRLNQLLHPNYSTLFEILYKMKKTETFIVPCGLRSAMPHMLVHHQVRDFATWKPLFDRHESTRKTSGSKNALVFQNVDNPTDVFILFEWDALEKAKKFATSDDLKKVMEQAGVVGMPHIHFLKEAGKSRA